MSRFSFHLFLFPQTLLLHIQKILYHVEIIIKPVPYSLIVNYLWPFIMCDGGFWLVSGLAEGTRRRRCCSCRQKAITQLHWFLTSVLSVSPSSPPANGCIMNTREGLSGPRRLSILICVSVGDEQLYTFYPVSQNIPHGPYLWLELCLFLSRQLPLLTCFDRLVIHTNTDLSWKGRRCG